MDTKNSILSLRGVKKQYSGAPNPAIEDITLDIEQGEIYGLVGENGAGKSTLIKTIAGAIEITDGEVLYKGEKLICKSPEAAIEKGIGVVYQEFNLFPNLAVYENIFFGIEVKKNGFLDRKLMIQKAQEILKQLGFELDVTKRVSTLSPAYQQATEIAKCINHNVELMIMDEPSAPLTEKEVGQMFKVVRKLNESGVTIIYISHKLNEIFDLTNRVSVLRDGHLINTFRTEEVTEQELIREMVGREITDIYPEKAIGAKDVILRVENLSSSKVHGVSFELRKGEALGFGGLVGAGRTEAMRLLFGADKKTGGTVYINGEEVQISNPIDAIRNGIGLIPEDRKMQGLVLNKSIFLNCLLPSINKYSKSGFIRFKDAHSDIGKLYDILKIKAVDQNQVVSHLSGGNQQKVVLEKWLLRNCDILILDEPTRGIDVGTKQEIYQLIKDLAAEGKAVIVISSEMPELIGVSHRIIVMHEGKVAGEVKGEEITQEAILTLAS